jgi:hypothetical protein
LDFSHPLSFEPQVAKSTRSSHVRRGKRWGGDPSKLSRPNHVIDVVPFSRLAPPRRRYFHRSSLSTSIIPATTFAPETLSYAENPRHVYCPSAAEESQRAAYLQDAQDKAISLFEGFEEIERSLIRPGRSEKDLSKEIYNLAAERFGVTKYWHNHITRSGPNTLMPYTENPPERIIQADNILFVDLGPVFEAYKADFR